MSQPVIGFIGVGLMGHGMAKNLVTKGYPLVVMGHRNREPVEHLKSLGATEVTTAACATWTPKESNSASNSERFWPVLPA